MIYHYVRGLDPAIIDSKFLLDLQVNIGKQIIDVEILENTMRELDKNGENQIQFAQVESILQKSNLKLDEKIITAWMKAAQTTGVGSCSISKLSEIIQTATNPTQENFMKTGKLNTILDSTAIR